jgi:MFS family permease
MRPVQNPRVPEQGIGASMTVPSAIGIISSYFSGVDRTRALSIYGASGTLGFCTGLIYSRWYSHRSSNSLNATENRKLNKRLPESNG